MLKPFTQAVGAGRSASFNMALAAQLNENGIYRYQKAYLGSDKDLIPSVYHLGYYLTQQIESDSTRIGLRPRIMDWYGWVPLGPIGFNIAVWLATRKSLNGHYTSLMQRLRADFGAEEQRRGYVEYETLNQRVSAAPVNYRFPRWENDGSVIAYRSGFDAVPRIIRFGTDGQETTVLRRRIGDNITIHNGILGWTETIPDLRWGWQLHNNVRLYDSREERFLEHTIDDRFLWIDFAPDSLKIAGVLNEGLYSNLVLCDLQKGRTIRLTTDNDVYYNYPRFSADGKKLVVVSRKDSIQYLQIFRYNQWRARHPAGNSTTPNKPSGVQS